MRAAPLALLLSALPGLPLGAQAGLLVPSSTGRPDARILSLREMTLDVGLARGYARVNVRQVFENHTGTAQEGTYTFSLPPSAAVGDFAVWDGLQRIPGVILERKRARSIYQELARQRIDPGLLQQGEAEDPGQGPGPRPSAGTLFSVTVAPIPPMATKRVELQFQQETPLIGGQGEFRLVLRPPGAEPPVAELLTIRIRLEDGVLAGAGPGLPLQATAGGASFTGQHVKLDQDLVLRFTPGAQPPLRLTTFRNPDGVLHEGLALAPWERPSELPPEPDGFLLLEALPPGGAARPAAPEAGQHLAILFDTSLAQRWGGLEAAYGHLVRVLQALRPQDRFALIPFDRTPEAASLLPVTAPNLEAQLTALRNRPLGPGADLPRALAQARRALAQARRTLDGPGRILLLTGGQGLQRARALREAAGAVPVFTVVTVGEAGPGLTGASTQLLSPTATELEGDLFFQRLLGAAPPPGPKVADVPFAVAGARLRDLYPVLVQPPEPGSLTGWIGRYAAPARTVRFTWPSPLFPGGTATLEGALPDRALEARDLPRRWARARVDDLLRRLEADGERRAWLDEVIALSKRYKFVTPYTAFLAAPRSLLRPRRIQPGDPVLRVACDPGTRSATALFPFGLKLDLVRRPGTDLWEGRFLVPEGLEDGRHPVRILLRDASGARLSETKHFILDGKAPEITPILPASCRAGDVVRVMAATDEDVVFLSARVGTAPPIPLRWDPAEKRCVGLLTVPYGATGPREVVFEAVDAARNRGFARAVLEVRP